MTELLYPFVGVVLCQYPPDNGALQSNAVPNLNRVTVGSTVIQNGTCCVKEQRRQLYNVVIIVRAT